VAVVQGAQMAARGMAASSNAAVQRVGVGAPDLAGRVGERVADTVKAPIGEYPEQKAGKAIDGGKDAAQAGGVGAKPSETAGGVATASDQFARAFGQFDELIGALPELGEAARSQVSLAMAAQELGKEALRLAGAGDARFTLDEIEKHLGPKDLKLIDFGAFTFPWETRDAVTQAQQDTARRTTGANPAAPIPGTAAPAPPAP
jgi:hypothetical protein